MMNASHEDNITSTHPILLIPLFLLLFFPLFSFYIQNNTPTFYALISLNILLCMGGLYTYKRARFYQPLIHLSWSLHIFIQALVQLSIFTYIVYMGPDNIVGHTVQERISLIFYQVIFAFVFEYLLTVMRGNVYRPSMYVIPMTFSLNLFIWFVGDYSALQVLLVVMAILTKNFIVRVGDDGRLTHIFNPSFLILALLAVFIFIFYEQVYHTNDVISVAMVTFYELTPGFDLFLICVGCITLWKPNSYLIPFGAYLTVMSLNALTLHFYDYVLFSGLVRGATLLTIMLGVTDPATSPHTKCGKFFFGVAYGLMLTLIYLVFFLFRLDKLTTFFKLLPVPVLNYYAGKFDPFFKTKYSITFMEHFYLSRIVSISMFGVIFYLTYQELESSLVSMTFLQVLARGIRAKLGI